jgi:hypothetical protein
VDEWWRERFTRMDRAETANRHTRVGEVVGPAAAIDWPRSSPASCALCFVLWRAPAVASACSLCVFSLEPHTLTQIKELSA